MHFRVQGKELKIQLEKEIVVFVKQFPVLCHSMCIKDA